MKNDKRIKNKEYIPVEELTEDHLDEIYLTGCVTLKCGCVVEPDGACPHGNKSPLIELGIL